MIEQIQKAVCLVSELKKIVDDTPDIVMIDIVRKSLGEPWIVLRSNSDDYDLPETEVRDDGTVERYKIVDGVRVIRLEG